MASIDALIERIENSELRKQIKDELERANKQRKFGLVFENHLPECTPLYDVPIKKGALVARYGEIKTIYRAISIKDGKADCIEKHGKGRELIPVDELVCVAEFGDPIYPYLQPVDSVCNAPDSDLWHTLIEADNYHALQLLDYLYHGKVDCIYIDPPYNKGNKDWKYNNNYVDSSDKYRHSKWLSMMEKRLKVAKRLLNPQNSVLIATIDEEEYAVLSLLLSQVFPEANIQIVDTRINATGVVRLSGFTRVDEYIFFVMLGDSKPLTESDAEGQHRPVQWHGLRRRDAESMRGTKKGGVAQFYPIYVNNETGAIEHIGDFLPSGVPRESAPTFDGCTTIFPLKPDGTEMNWGMKADALSEKLKKGYVRVKKSSRGVYPFSIEYLTQGYIDDIESGKAITLGYEKDGSIIAEYVGGKVKTQILTQWNNNTHYGKEFGTGLIGEIFPDKRFPYPKSVYAVYDCLRYYVYNNPNALIVDFFAGSGTTLHAVNLLNEVDNGKRRCIMITNNEVSVKEADELEKNGYHPGMLEWEKYGIAEYITWPRTVSSIKGVDISGKPLTGNYGIMEDSYELDDELTVVSKRTGKPTTKKIYVKKKIERRPELSTINKENGFASNCNYFKLGFLDKSLVALGTQLQKLIPVLWMKAGAIGECPSIDESNGRFIFPANKFAILTDTKYAYEFTQEVAAHDIRVAYVVTDYEPEYREIAKGLNVPVTYHLYRDYLDNFSINIRRS